MQNKVICKNKKILFDFDILNKFEAGINLKGNEVKSIRQGNINIKNGYISIREGEAYLCGVHISSYQKNSLKKPEEKRDRKILLHKKEIIKIESALKTKGLTCLVLSIYTKKGLIKAEIVIAKGRKKYDKRNVLKERSMEKDARKIIRSYK